MLGDERPEVWIGQHLSICYSEESNRRGKEEIEPALMRDGYWQGELSMVSRQGKLIPTWQNSFVIMDGKGAPLRLAVVITDITERKQAEERMLQAQELLKESETRYRAVIENQGEGLGIVDPQERFTFANPAGEQIFGVPRGSLAGRSLREFMTDDQYAKVLEQTKKRQAGEKSTYELEIVHPSGETRCLLVTAVPKIDKAGAFVETFGLFFDITERKQVQEALRQSHDELRAIYDGMADGIVIVDIETTTPVRANAALCQILGYSDEEVKTVTIHHAHPPEAMPKIQEFVQIVAQRGVARFDNMPFLRKDGSVCYADVVTRQILYNGRICRISFLHDVTERKAVQEALERERQSLWRMLQASDHERQTISYDIHDGLAQYLAAASMQFQAHDSLKDSSPDQARKSYETAVELVRQAHAESRRLISEVRPPVIDEVGLETAILHLVHEHRRHGGPKIKCDSDVQFGKLPPILENALYRIAQEALTNACKHSKSKKVTVTMTQDGQDVRLEVRDWGIGFDPESVEKGHFGLEGIRQRVRLLGGRLVIDSKPGSGATIQVVVPILERQNEQ
jgi:PAS domain S-box-containing protein